MVVPELATLLKDAAPEVRIAAAVALLDFGKDAKAAVKPLLEALVDPEAEVRRIAMEALQRIALDVLATNKVSGNH
jgi:HEAT repeat protein